MIVLYVKIKDDSHEKMFHVYNKNMIQIYIIRTNENNYHDIFRYGKLDPLTSNIV